MRVPCRVAFWALVFGIPIGCAPVLPAIVVPDAEGVHPYGGFEVSCNKPVELTRDCSYFSGGTRSIVIGSTEIKIGGSADGKTVIMRDPATTNLSTGFRSPADWTSNTNLRFRIVKNALAERGIHVLHAVPVTQSGMVLSYIVTYDGDAYSILEEFTGSD